MPGRRFCRYELRTTDLSAASAFYTHVLGSQFWDSNVSLSSLPDRAAARGAPAHWLGHIGVRDVEEMTRRIATLGGQQLGPVQADAAGLLHAVVRDPFGAVLAVSSEAVSSRPSAVWHVSHTEDHEQAFAWYADLFGWTSTERLDLGPERGRHQLFAWDESARSVGSMANTARLPHIHPQWLFFFPVVVLVILILSIFFIGDGLREALDPKKNRVRA